MDPSYFLLPADNRLNNVNVDALAVLPNGLFARTVQMHIKGARRNNGDHIYHWYRIIETRYGKAYARRLYKVARERAERA